MPTDPNTDASQDDAYDAMLQGLITNNKGPFNDTPPMLGPHDYANYINQSTNDPPYQNAGQEDVTRFRAQRMLGAAQKATDVLNDPEAFIDDPAEKQNTLEQLIPKVVSKTATKDEYMHFYRLTGTAL